MEILITNDDSLYSLGLHNMIELAVQFGHVTVVAPKEVQSAKSCSVNINKTLQLELITKDKSISVYAFSGTPIDCVKLALGPIYKGKKPDLLLSGINHGPNTAACALYSGTLGATAEGARAGIKSIGLSICTHDPEADFTAVKHIGKKILEKAIKEEFINDTFLNVNFPNIPENEIKGVKVCRLGRGYWRKEFEPAENGDPMQFVLRGSYINMEEEDAECDYNLIQKGYVTITPQHTYTSNLEAVENLREILNINL